MRIQPGGGASGHLAHMLIGLAITALRYHVCRRALLIGQTIVGQT